MQKYYSVCCKCGHVGRGKYIPLNYPICAENAKEAAAIARNRGGVKHHHRDAVLSVEEITRKQFYQLRREQDNDLYWKRAKSNICGLAARIEDELEPGGRDERFYKKVALRVRRQKRALSEREIYFDLAKEYGFKAV